MRWKPRSVTETVARTNVAAYHRRSSLCRRLICRSPGFDRGEDPRYHATLTFFCAMRSISRRSNRRKLKARSFLTGAARSLLRRSAICLGNLPDCGNGFLFLGNPQLGDIGHMFFNLIARGFLGKRKKIQSTISKRLRFCGSFCETFCARENRSSQNCRPVCRRRSFHEALRRYLALLSASMLSTADLKPRP